jgi:hypothetical protein
MIPSPRSLALLALLAGLASPGRAAAQPRPLIQGARVEPNVIYGMYSGLALVLDVHTPPSPNGYGVIFISGSGWQAPIGYDATPLKQNQIPIWGPALLKAGYTVFALNQRAVPRFHYPGAVDDVQRAIRFVRHHAKDYGIDPARIGGMGGSSGGHLIALTALLAAPGVAAGDRPARHADRSDRPGQGRSGRRRHRFPRAPLAGRIGHGPAEPDDRAALQAGVPVDARLGQVAADAPHPRRRRRGGAVRGIGGHGSLAQSGRRPNRADPRARRGPRGRLRGRRGRPSRLAGFLRGGRPLVRHPPEAVVKHTDTAGTEP